VYCTYHNVDQAIKKLIIESFDDAYLNALSDEIMGYTNCTSLQLLTHLLTHYAMIAPTELTQNYERLNAPYDPNQPIETLFQKIQDARAFAVAGEQPYGAAMIVNVAYTLVFNTGLFPDACRAWQSRAIAGKTWAQFKLYFFTAHREFRLTNQTAQQSGFHSANMMIEQGREKNARHSERNRPLGNSNSFRSRNPSHIDYHQCQACHATRGFSSTDCAAQGQHRGPKEQDQTCLARSTTCQDDEQ
jgi:hypothetical protein